MPARSTTRLLTLASMVLTLSVSFGCSYEVLSVLTASDGYPGDKFGSSVDVDAEQMVVGAIDMTGDPHGYSASLGAAYIFQRSGEAWSQVARLESDDPQDDDEFGRDVAISGDTAVVGCPIYDVKLWNEGVAFVFEKVGGNWAQVARLVHQFADKNHEAGRAVDISGETIVVGCSSYNGYRGAVFVFVRQDGAWVESQTLTAPDGAPSDWFGKAVAIAGNTIVVGAQGANDQEQGYDRAGAVYIFRRSGSNFVPVQKLLAGDSAEENDFGASVDISPDALTVAIGATQYHSINYSNPPYGVGKVYVFEADGQEYIEVDQLVPAEAAEGFGVGRSLAVWHDMIVTTMAGTVGPRKAYVFQRFDGQWVEQEPIYNEQSPLSQPAIGEDLIALCGSTAATLGGFEVQQGGVYLYDQATSQGTAAGFSANLLAMIPDGDYTVELVLPPGNDGSTVEATYQVAVQLRDGTLRCDRQQLPRCHWAQVASATVRSQSTGRIVLQANAKELRSLCLIR